MEVKLTFLNGARRGEKYLFDGHVSLGRSEGNTIAVNDNSVSNSHCEILEREGRVLVRNLGSTNGTTVNGRVVSARGRIRMGGELAEIHNDDVVAMGETKFLVEFVGTAMAPACRGGAGRPEAPEGKPAVGSLAMQGRQQGPRWGKRKTVVAAIVVLTVLAVLGGVGLWKKMGQPRPAQGTEWV